MRMNVLLRKLHLDRKEFVTSRELKTYCRSMKLNYETVIRYFAARGYLVRIFRGIFYVRSPEELRLGNSRYNHMELVAKAMELKNVKNWYFGLHSALKLNNMTHEHFVVEDVVSDMLFRAKPLSIAGYKFRFIKLSPSLVGFGIQTSDRIVYSDPEKTVLDFVYLWRYNGVPAEKIVADISGWTKKASRERLLTYARKYPKTVERMIERIAA